MSFPKKVVSTGQLKTRIKSEQNKLWNYFLLAIHPRQRRNSINMHMDGGETSTRAQEVTEGLVSVGSERCYDCTRAVGEPGASCNKC